MNQHFQRIIDDATARLTDLTKEAQQTADKARKELGMLSEFAENIPHQMLDTCSHIFVGELKYDEENKYSWSSSKDAKLTVCGVTVDFMPWDNHRAGPRKMEMKPGKYRAVVVLQKVE